MPSLEHNTTWDLVEDIEKLRTEVAKVDKWQVFGGSWGSTLALAYAADISRARRPSWCCAASSCSTSMRSTGCTSEGGASQLYPDKFDEFLAPIPEAERGDLVEAYRKRLTSDDEDEQLRRRQGVEQVGGRHRHPAARARTTIEHFTAPEVAVAVARIENHYMANHGWLEEGQLLKGAARSCAAFPGVIVQGRHDCCTPPVAAWELKQAWPEVELNIIPDGGHLFSEPGMLDGLVRATDKFAGL